MEGKVVVVSGASSGIGAEICVQLANDGQTVVGLARRVEKIDELKEKISNDSTGKIVAYKCDVENSDEIVEAFQWIKKEFNKLDVFINNAGIMMTSFVSEDEPDNLRKLFEVNVIAACTCIKEAVKVIQETSGRGNVIVMNSVLGHRIPDMPPNLRPPFGIYPATKHALTALCQTLRQEMNFLKLPIKITSISPGMVETDFLSDFNPQLCAILPKLSTEDIAEAVKYVLNTPDRVRIDDIIINPV